AQKLASAVDPPKPERLWAEPAPAGDPNELRQIARVCREQRRLSFVAVEQALEALLRRHDAQHEAMRAGESADGHVLLHGRRRARADVDLHAVVGADLTAE